MIDLGIANEWQEAPEVVKLCTIKAHQKEITKESRCLTIVKCSVCLYFYKFDSND